MSRIKHEDRELVQGWAEDIDIPYLLSALPFLLDDNRYALVTCLDSEREVAHRTDLRTVATASQFSSWILGHGVVLPVEAVRTLLEDDAYFTGFDELWLFAQRPTSPMPSNIVITAEGPVHTRDLTGLASWMTTTMCRLGLGDGAGLNYVTPDESLAIALQSAW